MDMIKMTSMMVLGFAMVLLAFGYVNGGPDDKNKKNKKK
jgi:hypothetical protein